MGQFHKCSSGCRDGNIEQAGLVFTFSRLLEAEPKELDESVR
jgi:hypothetical protein